MARSIGAPLDVFVVRKIGLPEDPEYGIGAITESGFYRISPAVSEWLKISDSVMATLVKVELDEVRRRVRKYRGHRKLPDLRGRTVIIVDDGIATGITARVAAEDLRRSGAVDVILAAPVGAKASLKELRDAGEYVVCLQEPERFSSVGLWYDKFSQLNDKDVLSYLGPVAPHGADLRIPEKAKGVIVFAHGSGSGRLSPRNRAVASELNHAGFGTLLFDFLTEEESLDRDLVFDIPNSRIALISATQWLRSELRTKNIPDLPIGYFGASTGAAAALWAASFRDNPIDAIVSRGGRPDLAMTQLESVPAPTLLIVGSRDEAVLEMNRSALKKLKHGELVVVAGGHSLVRRARGA